MKPRLLDLFCGAGGAARGYQWVGFDVTGIDIKPQPRYAGDRFIQGDALSMPVDPYEFDVIHASPPCQLFSRAGKLRDAQGGKPSSLDLLTPTRAMLGEIDVPYIIENVPGSPLQGYVQLCGSGFGVPIKRHRWFEASVPLVGMPCNHHAFPPRFTPAWNRSTPLRFLSPSNAYLKDRADMALVEEAFGIDWMKPAELSEAIPPVYTCFIGEQVRERLLVGAAKERST